VLAFLTPQQRADFVTYSNKAAGWFVVGAGATLIGIKEAADLVHALDWPSPITIPLVVLAGSIHGPPHAPDPARRGAPATHRVTRVHSGRRKGSPAPIERHVVSRR
jgi:hypothetical protein